MVLQVGTDEALAVAGRLLSESADDVAARKTAEIACSSPILSVRHSLQ